MNFPSSQPSPRYPLAWGERTYIMGILNVTPDSFSGDGLLAREGEDARNLVSLAMELGRKYVSVGADILDVGGESTRPGSQPTSLNEEIERVIPVIQALAAELDVIISVDTYKAEVADSALQAGAHMVNDVWGLRADPALGSVVARNNVPIILMHNKVASELYEKSGRAEGRDLENWLEAERILNTEIHSNNHDSSEEISKVASLLYEKSGQTEGCYLENWLKAERILKEADQFCEMFKQMLVQKPLSACKLMEAIKLLLELEQKQELERLIHSA